MVLLFRHCQSSIQSSSDALDALIAMPREHCHYGAHPSCLAANEPLLQHPKRTGQHESLHASSSQISMDCQLSITSCRQQMPYLIQGWVCHQQVHTIIRMLVIVKSGDLFMTIVSLKDSTKTSSDTWVRHSRIGLVGWVVNGGVVR